MTMSGRIKIVSATMKAAATTAPSHSGGAVGCTNNDINRVWVDRSAAPEVDRGLAGIASDI
jgi:hypothetical protein